MNAANTNRIMTRGANRSMISAGDAHRRAAVRQFSLLLSLRLLRRQAH
jgi:hypothetical protein